MASFDSGTMRKLVSVLPVLAAGFAGDHPDTVGNTIRATQLGTQARRAQTTEDEEKRLKEFGSALYKAVGAGQEMTPAFVSSLMTKFNVPQGKGMQLVANMSAFQQDQRRVKSLKAESERKASGVSLGNQLLRARTPAENPQIKSLYDAFDIAGVPIPKPEVAEDQYKGVKMTKVMPNGNKRTITARSKGHYLDLQAQGHFEGDVSIAKQDKPVDPYKGRTAYLRTPSGVSEVKLESAAHFNQLQSEDQGWTTRKFTPAKTGEGEGKGSSKGGEEDKSQEKIDKLLARRSKIRAAIVNFTKHGTTDTISVQMKETMRELFPGRESQAALKKQRVGDLLNSLEAEIVSIESQLKDLTGSVSEETNLATAGIPSYTDIPDSAVFGAPLPSVSMQTLSPPKRLPGESIPEYQRRIYGQ